MFLIRMSFIWFLILSSSLFEVRAYDEFNTYRWNRDNVTAQNGKTDKRPWFEWWYYKVVLPETNEAFYFVYGVVNPWDSRGVLKGTRSYVGFGDFQVKKSLEQKFLLSEFESLYDETYVSVANNIATDKHFYGEINDDGQHCRWDIKVNHHWSFNATGWATGKLLTNIEWYPAQADASCSGTIESHGKTYEFKDAPCYQDRNWGFSFPDWWTWIVSNKFKDHPETSLAIGGGRPTFFGRFKPIEGVAIGLKHGGKEYSWRPNDFDKVRLSVNFGKWEVLAVNEDYKIQIVAHAPKEKFMDLQFVTPQGDIFHDYETLLGNVSVKLYKKPRFLFANWELIEVLSSEFTGIEYGSHSTHEKSDIFNSERLLFSNFP